MRWEEREELCVTECSLIIFHSFFHPALLLSSFFLPQTTFPLLLSSSPLCAGPLLSGFIFTCTLTSSLIFHYCFSLPPPLLFLGKGRVESYHGNSKLATSYLYDGLQRKREEEGQTKGCLSFTLFAMSRKY